jgi:uncharacterized membrane protein
MQWIFAFIGIFFTALADENVFAGGIIGFLLGLVISVIPRIKKLELQLQALKQQLNQLKQPQTKHANADNVTAESPLKSASEPSYITEQDSEPVNIPGFQQQADSNKEASTPDPWVSDGFDKLVKKQTPKTENVAVDFGDPVFKDVKTSNIVKLFQIIWNWFTDGNTFVRVGIVILFVGVSFLLNFAIDSGFISIELRLAVVAGFALFLLSVGWKLREKRTSYALLIQGGAVGLLYLTIFASFSLYQVLPASLAFGFLVIIVALSTSLAILQNALSLVLFAVIGGFLAPILTSTGSNNYIGLFSFYTLLNIGIFAVAWFKAWKILNLVGFTFTFSISSFWGASRYQPENFASIEPFLILFFLFYVGIAILYASRKAPDYKDYIDGTLIFGTPIIAFGMQAAIVNRFEYGVAISAFVMGAFYLLLAAWCWKKMGENLRFLSETLLAVAVIFVTLAIPFAVDGSITSATWAVEATGVLWISIRQEQHLRRLFALILQLFAGVALLSDATQYHSSVFLNSSFIGVLIITICAGITSWMLYQPFADRKAYETKLSPWILAYSLLWLFAGYGYQINSHSSLTSYHGNLILFLTLICTAVLAWLAKRYSWPTANKAAIAMMLPLLLVVLDTLLNSSHPTEHYGSILWPLAIALYYFNLKMTKTINHGFNLTLHLLTTALMYALLIWEGLWQALLAASLLSIMFYHLYRHYQWQQMRACALSLLPLMIFITIRSLTGESLHPFELADNTTGINWSFEAGYVLWPLAFTTLYHLLYRCDKDEPSNELPEFHVLSLLLLVLLPTWETSWHLIDYLPFMNGWHIAIFPITSIIALWLIMQEKFWPFKQQVKNYYCQISPFLIVYLFIWTVSSLFSAANSNPLPWLPFFNPAELIQVLVFISLIRFIFVSPEYFLSTQGKRNAYIAIAGLTFIWLNFVLLRILHHSSDLSWSGSLLQAPITQTSLSIFWTLTGLSLAVLATRKQVRKLWVVGATVLVVVVIKLFLFDMSSHNSIERIISFIGVGILLMLIGYYAPLPPANKEGEEC